MSSSHHKPTRSVYLNVKTYTCAGQLSLLPSAGREYTGQSAVMLCSWGAGSRMARSTCG